MTSAVVLHPALPPVPLILVSGVEAAEEITQATKAVPMVLPAAYVLPSTGTSAPAVVAQRRITDPLVVLKSVEADVVQLSVTLALPAVPLVAVAPAGDRLSTVTVALAPSDPYGGLVLVKAVTVPPTA